MSWYCHDFEENISPMWLAFSMGNLEKINSLIESGADVNERYNGNGPNIKGYTFFHTMSLNSWYRGFEIEEESKFAVADLLVTHGADINSLIDDEEDSTPLDIVFRWGDPAVCKFLLSRGARFDNSKVYCILEQCESSEYVEILTLLFEYGLDPEIRTVYNENLLSSYLVSLSRRNENIWMTEVARVLVNKGVSASSSGCQGLGMGPLYYAVRIGSKKLVEFLVDNGADVNEESSGNPSNPRGYPLYDAVYFNNEHLVDYFLSKGAYVNARINTGHTALHMACHHNCNSLISLLIRKGADVTQKDNSGKVPFYFIRRILSQYIFTKNLAKLYYNNESRLSADSKNSDVALAINHNTNYLKYFEKCQKELSEMESKMLDYRSLSMYSLLGKVDNLKELYVLAKKKIFRENFLKYLPSLLIFEKDLSKVNIIVQKVENRIEVENRLSEALNSVFPSLVLHNLSHYLSLQDIPLYPTLKIESDDDSDQWSYNDYSDISY